MVPVLTLVTVLGGLPPISVSLEPADCPTEVQVSRVLAALGAKLVPFGSPARATVAAVRTESGEWSLTLGRPGHSEKRKVTLSGGCDERAAALGAIIERFARPVLVLAQREALDAGPLDAGVVAGLDAGFEPWPFDAGELVAPPPPPPPPPPLVVVADAGETAPPDAGPSVPSDRYLALSFHLGVGFTDRAAFAVGGPTFDVRRGRVGFSAGFDYAGPLTVGSEIGNLSVHSFRLQALARVLPISHLWLEGGLAINAVWVKELHDTLRFRPGFTLAVTGALRLVEPFEAWLRLRGWVFANLDKDLFSFDEVLLYPTFTGELTAGLTVRL